MISIFTIPKAFVGHSAIIQRNAIRSWLQLEPNCEIMLLGDDPGVEDAARDLGIMHIPSIDRNQFGTPLLSSAFSTAQQIANNDIIMYVNSDIIFFQQFIDVMKTINFPRFLLCGKRWDLDVQNEIDFSHSAWVDEFLLRLRSQGKPHGHSGLDYFIFRRTSVNMRSFAVGRPGWDNWLIYDMRRKKIPVVDASKVIIAIHQNHDYSHSEFGEKKRVGGPEWAENIKMAGGLTNMLTLRDADWLMTKEGPERPSFARRIHPLLSLWYPWRLLLVVKRKLQWYIHEFLRVE